MARKTKQMKIRTQERRQKQEQVLEEIKLRMNEELKREMLLIEAKMAEDSMRFEELGGMSDVQVGVVHDEHEKERCSFCTGKNGAFLAFFEDKEQAEYKNYFLLICWNCAIELRWYLNASDFLGDEKY